ncbi:unnamed protein product [Brassica napus]|uniref:(rape) hypothetical protein n=1 Tax=Brassica napus TaxID=3708 RepID=A0A816J6E4_BRANA|nr:unnamed protein product [Brassica napus]
MFEYFFSLQSKMADTPSSPAGDGGESGGGSVREQDRYLPIANISRIMKKALPPNGKIGKDAKDTVQECVSEFISFITSEASDKCQKEKRKTVNGEDLLWAMATLGFEDYLEPLKVYLARYREGDNKGSGKSGDGSNRDAAAGGVPNEDMPRDPVLVGCSRRFLFIRYDNSLKEGKKVCPQALSSLSFVYGFQNLNMNGLTCASNYTVRAPNNISECFSCYGKK